MGQLVDAFQRAVNAVQVKNCITQYENTGDGRHIWQALLHLHQAGEPMPQEVFDKLAEWASAVLLADTSDDLAAAVQMKGDSAKKKGLSRSRNYTKRWRIASYVKRLQGLDPDLLLKDAITMTAAQFSETEPMVKRAFYEIFEPESEAEGDPNALADVMKNWR